ncbi:bifunctional UDP-N-acetylmuramoyl-tripeptide:D-alanyl-D-alanine ligase/alanine racemase [Flavobacteriaceae bacterium Ap0902]|nr:bifunctional UDP-N-acetylmuramoyl-tripeptide:D-alanyl-D-alanine ligase/alanine racemase [Flavobacteriaceae bacterium Ap0902]
MIPYTLEKIGQIIHAEIIGDKKAVIDQVWFDSRHVAGQSQGIFFAIPGVQRDGANFIKEVFEKGVQNFVVTKAIKELPANFLVVDDVTRALQKWATYHRQQYKSMVVGITGTHGKTIVKEWLYQLLYQQLSIVRSPKSYNSQIGVPLSILEMTPDADLSVIELGISKPGEMESISAIVNPDIAVLTMMGNAHSESFKNREEQAQEKIKLFVQAKKIIIPFDDALIRDYVLNHYNHKQIVTFGSDENADVQLASALNNPNMTIKYKGRTYHLQLPFNNEAAIYNALICFTVVTQLHVDLNKVIGLFNHLQPVEMRLAQKEGINNTVLIDDTYNSDLSSILIALNALNNHPYFRKTLILTDVLQDRLKPKELYTKVAHWVNAYPIQKVILIGKEIDQYKDLFKNLFASYRDTESFLDHLNVTDFHEEVILLKGARKYELERISKFFQVKSHDTVLEVDLENLISNVKYLKSKLNPSTEMMAMVKADGYGMGAVGVAQALMNYHIKYFGVAYADEGEELRKHGITQNIMVLNPEQSSYDTIINNQLEPEVYSFRMLNNFTEALIQHKIQVSYPIHLKLNTGMNRLGFKKEQISELIQQLADNPYVKVKSIFSHFATSDIPEQEDFVHQQAALYQEMYDRIAFNLGYNPIRHISNTAAILHYPEYQMDMVRPGIGIYGVSPDEENQKFLKNVVTFKTVISQINELEIGETVSYGRRFTALEPTKIATLPVGYADGVKRILGNGNGHVMINGQEAKTVGTTCMDMMMVDITHINCKEGDEVIIFGENLSVKKLASWCNTIPYEILTSVSKRVKRIYIQ